jgi:hypothetical protein
VSKVEEVVDAVGVDTDRPVLGQLPLGAGAIAGGAVDLRVPLGLLPVLLLLLRGELRLRRLGLRVGHAGVEVAEKLRVGKEERTVMEWNGWKEAFFEPRKGKRDACRVHRTRRLPAGLYVSVKWVRPCCDGDSVGPSQVASVEPYVNCVIKAGCELWEHVDLY